MLKTGRFGRCSPAALMAGTPRGAGISGKKKARRLSEPFNLVVDGLLPNNLLLGAMSDAAGDWARATGQGHTFTWSRTLFNGEKSGAASFISAIIASSTYFSAMSGEMTMP